MTVAEFVEWLKTQDQAAEVWVVEHASGKGYYDQGGRARQVAFDPAKHAEHSDYSHLQIEGQAATELLLGVLDG